MYISSGTPSYGSNIHAEVQLPIGASINDLTCLYRDTSATGDLFGGLSLYMRPFLDTQVTALGTVSLGTPSLDSDLIQQVSDPISHSVSNNNFYYLGGSYAQVELGQTLRFYGCRISYTVSGP